MKVVWSPLAIEHISEISEYIAQDDLMAAQQWVDKIFGLSERLSAFPESGRNVPEISGNYRVIYKYENESVYILRVRHGRQILPIDEIKA